MGAPQPAATATDDGADGAGAAAGVTTPAATAPRMSTADRLVYGLLSVAGVSFWFLLGFPYANHNESFAIVAQLREMGFLDSLTQIAYPVANYRPLGQAIAWLDYRSDGIIASVQVFNYVIAAAAWLLLFASVRERRTFAVTAFVVGGVFFTGYIYLFHLHGVFYSPLLFLVALLFWADRDLTRRRLAVVAGCAAVAALFHPYALLVLVAALAGMALERRRASAGLRVRMLAVAGGAVVLFLVLAVTQRRTDPRSIGEMVDGLLASYRMVEINALVSMVAFALAVATALTVPGPRRLRVAVAVVAALAAVAAHLVGAPVLLVWVAVCLGKAALMQKWWLVLALACTAAFPAPTATGSPTYTVFALMVCCAIVPAGSAWPEDRLGRKCRAAVIAAIAAASVLLVALRIGVEVPVVSRLAQPLVAEQEKTFQMEEIVQWLLASEYSDRELAFVRDVNNPAESSNSIDRVNRPPTNDRDLARYVQAFRGDRTLPADPAPPLLVGFGSDEMPPGVVLLVLPSEHAGDAVVVLPVS